jgi:hypothetical protein
MRACPLPIVSILLMLAMAPPVFAGGENNSKTQTCTPDKTVTTTTPVTSCNPYTVQVPTGRNICNFASAYSDGSADFGGSASCAAETYPVSYSNCSTTNVVSTTVVKGNCVVDGCTTGGHNCNHGGGPGG